MKHCQLLFYVTLPTLFMETLFTRAIQDFINARNYPTFKPKAIFFDMDGVLFDSMKNHATAWVKAMQDVDIDFTLEEAYMNEGSTGHATIDRAFKKNKGRNASEDEKQEIYKLKTKYFEACDPIERMPFALELVNRVKEQELQIFVVTGSGQPTLINSLHHHFPDAFCKEKMVTAFDVKQGKPFPEPYLKALQKSGVEAWEAVVIENAPLGVESGNAAGLFTIGVNTGPLDKKVLSENGAHIVFDGGMEELFNHWDDFLSSWM